MHDTLAHFDLAVHLTAESSAGPYDVFICVVSANLTVFSHPETLQGSRKACNVQERASLPTPNDSQVQCVEMPGGLYAVRSFSGKVSDKDGQEQLQVLYQKLARDKLEASPDKWTLARYNDPSTKGPFRLNEVLVNVTNFNLWGQDDN